MGAYSRRLHLRFGERRVLSPLAYHLLYRGGLTEGLFDANERAASYRFVLAKPLIRNINQG